IPEIVLSAEQIRVLAGQQENVGDCLSLIFDRTWANRTPIDDLPDDRETRKVIGSCPRAVCEATGDLICRGNIAQITHGQGPCARAHEEFSL
ncbi:MAG TPA: hypothetical protein VFB59_00300, partial [Candidatus Saccharimonadales bacterium]|nr:hypothetical protein [Candidatus Saccharimonadales bacterium]